MAVEEFLDWLHLPLILCSDSLEIGSKKCGHRESATNNRYNLDMINPSLSAIKRSFW